MTYEEQKKEIIRCNNIMSFMGSDVPVGITFDGLEEFESLVRSNAIAEYRKELAKKVEKAFVEVGLVETILTDRILNLINSEEGKK